MDRSNDHTGAVRTTDRHDRDFPLFTGRLNRVSTRGWMLIIVGWLAATACDLFIATPGPSWVAVALRGILFAGIPLVTIAAMLPDGLRQAYSALFTRVRRRDIGLMIIFAALNVLATFAIGAVLGAIRGAGMHANPVNDTLAAQSPAALVLFYLSTLPQLIGEEVFTVVPFLAVLTLSTLSFGLGRRTAITLAVVVSAVLFALLHLPTYDWDLIQVLAIIGMARVILLIPYLITKNLWVSVGAHVLNDWTLFTLPLLTAAVAH